MNFLLLLIAMLTSQTATSPDTQQGRSEGGPLFSFGVIADVQYCDCDPALTRYFRNSLQKLDEAMQVFASEKLEFIIDLGDIIDRDYSSYASVNDIIDKYNIPVIHTPGNHDYSVDRKFIKGLPFPSAGKGYYSENHNGFRFIALNGNEVSTYGPGTMSERRMAGLLIEKMKSEGKVNAEIWNGGLSTQQLKWLDNELGIASDAGEKVFIACHFPLWPTDPHVILNQEEVLNILSKYDNIIAWFSGHDHQGGYGNYNLIHCVTFRGMVETEKDNSYAIVDVYKNKIWIRGFGREKSRILAY